ncbi:MAG TPA: hypothetical protein VLW50_09250 [Streptosporangiaceae bacterium]|nr:hypothetical protein [Streptosporangiaceae bacterium]
MRRTGGYPAAAQALEHALCIFRGLGGRGGEVTALNESGRCTGSAVTSCRPRGATGRPWTWPAPSPAPRTRRTRWPGPGRCARAAGHATLAAALLQQALEIFQRIGPAEAADLLAELDALTGPPPAQ